MLLVAAEAILFFALGFALLVLARLSRRLGQVTKARPYYRGLYLAALVLWGGAAGRLAFTAEMNDNILVTLVNDGLPALGVTLGLAVAWYYWSWLLTERD